MALTRTSLSAACTKDAVQLAITSTSTGFPVVGAYTSPQQVMQVDGEYMLVVNVPASGYVNVAQRGYNGSKAVAHDILAPVTTTATAQDWIPVGQGEVVNRPPDVNLVLNIGQDGAIAVPAKDTDVIITKATACLATLAAPAKDQDGVRLTITSATAAAHVVTAVALLGDAVTGSPHGTATYAAYIGSSLVLEAANSVWNVISAVGVTIT